MGLSVLLLLLLLLPIIAVACIYTAVTRTTIVTNVSVVLLKALLRLQNVTVDGDGCAVEQCPGGIVLKDVVLPQKLLEVAAGSVIFQSASIKRLHLLWPTSSSPLTLCVTGIAIVVLQRRTAPKVQPCACPPRRHGAKLNTVEVLLWGEQQNTFASGWRGQQLRLFRFMVALALRNVFVVIADTELQYQQSGDPGPRLLPSELSMSRAVDVVAVTIRTVEVSPMASTKGEAQAAAEPSQPEGSACNAPCTSGRERSRRLHLWRDVSDFFPKIQALYSWFDRLIMKFHPIEDCNAARVSVAGVNVLFKSKTPRPARVTSATHQEASLQQPGYARTCGSPRLRARSGVPGRVSPILARSPAAIVTGKSAAPAAAAPEWDYVATVLRQWNMRVDVSVGSQPIKRSSVRHPAARDADTTLAIGCGAGFAIHVEAVLKAFVLELAPEGVAHLLRIVDRAVTYEKYSVYWSQRPTVTVAESPAAWWQHAGRAIINDCREHFPLRNVRVLLARRAEYLGVYKELHSMQRGFRFVTYLPKYELSDKYKQVVTKFLVGRQAASPAGNAESFTAGASAPSSRPSAGGCGPGNDLRSSAVPGQQKQPFPLEKVLYYTGKHEASRSANLLDRLAQLESQLPLGQTIINRAFVALWHSVRLAPSCDARTRWLDAMDVIANFVDAIPTMDEIGEGSDSMPTPEVGKATADRSSATASGRVHRAQTAAQISLGVSCPRLGLKLVNKQLLRASSSATTGPAGANVESAATSESIKQPADVLAVMLEGIHLCMPDTYRINLQAATIRMSLLGGVTGGPKHVLVVPSSRECADEYGVKLDFSSAGPLHTQGSTPAKDWALEGAIYPDAPISLYLSRYKVNIAAVEMAFNSPPFVIASARFIDSMVQLKAARRKAEAGMSIAVEEWPSTNLHLLVMDSYTRDCVRVPSSMAAFMPKLQFYCPMVSVRWMLAATCTPSIGGISGQHSEILTVAVLTHLGQFAKMWLHPDDVEVAFPYQALSVPHVATQLQEASLKRPSRAYSRGLSGSVTANSMASLLPTLTFTSEAARGGQQRTHDSYPFLPVLKVRSMSAMALNQVPYEPAVPGTMTTHHTVGVHSVMVWFSPWHATALNAVIDSLLTHPVLVNARNRKRQQSDSDSEAGREPIAAQSGAAEPAQASGNEMQSAGPAPRNQRKEPGSPAASGSSISLLLDVPLLTVSCYAEMPEAFHFDEVVESEIRAMRESGRALQLPAWITKHLVSKELVGIDPVLRWGRRLAPLFTANMANIRSGLRLAKRNCVRATVQSTGLQISDHQARLKRSLYAKVWLANSGKGSDGPGIASVQGLLPEDSASQLFGPLPTRAAAVRDFARDRRRAALCLPSSQTPIGEKRGQIRQQWRRLLEVQLLHRASDFAMFLLSPTHRTVARLQLSLPEPLESYRILFQEHMKGATPNDFSYAVGATASANLAEPTPASPSRSSAVDCSNHPRSTPTPAVLHSSGRPSSVSALGSIAALFGASVGRGGGGSQPNPKSSLIQMLEAVRYQSTIRMAALRHSAILLAGRGPATGSTSSTPAQGGFTRRSMSPIPEDARQPPSSFILVRDDGPLQSVLGHDVEPSGADPLSRALQFHFNEAGRFRPSGSVESAGISVPTGLDSSTSLQSAFGTANVQSQRAAAQDRPYSSQSSTGNPSEAELKLSFVQAYRHLGTQSVWQRRTTYVHNMPLVTPVIAVVMAQAAASPEATTLHATCQHVISSVGVHSVLMEEPPRRLPCPPTHAAEKPCLMKRRPAPGNENRKEPGLTELTSLELRHVSVITDTGTEGTAGLALKMAISDIIVLDLQGCVEHRNVLVAKAQPPSPVDSPSTFAQPGFSFRAAVGQDTDEFIDGTTCAMQLEYRVVCNPDVPTSLKVSVFNPSITWLRRYSNNLLYAIGVLGDVYKSAVQQSNPGYPGETAASAQHESTPRESTPGIAMVSPPRKLAPRTIVEAFNVKVLLPGGAAASHGPIRRAVHNEAVSLEMRSITLCIPGDLASLHDNKMVDEDGLCGGAAWMVLPEEVHGLISSSLRLGDKHFPQINKQAHLDEHLNAHRCPDQGPGTNAARRQRQVPAERRASSPSTRLHRRLQAAKASFIDPLKEILQDAGHKRTKQRGELGIFLIDEHPGRGPTGELNPGYLSIDDDENPLIAGGTGTFTQHTTTTVHAANTQGPVAHEAAAGSKRSLRRSSDLPSSQATSQPISDSSFRAVDEAQALPNVDTSDVSREYSPMVLISVSGFAASSGRLVPCDSSVYHERSGPKSQFSQHAPGSASQRQQPEDASVTSFVSAVGNADKERILPADLQFSAYDGRPWPKRKLVEYDPEVESALYLMADTELQSVHQMIEPVDLKGAVFQHKQHGAVQVHISALGAMVATLGPQRYECLMKVLTDNVTEAYSCFNVGETLTASTGQLRTTFTPNRAFTPQPGQLPYFHLTVEWSEQLRAVLESDPAWWKHGEATASDVEPCLEACFTQSSLGLMMAHKTNDMFLAFYSQQLHSGILASGRLIPGLSSLTAKATLVLC
ncbi:hypothetical protein VOLCADRAFT_86643 [Volvox carteri f. nagariensis]|uniref:Uncharacterized protein n=1 Tax=Volvox carteri f. nagariensis TaxID=3068 RepID=D8TJ76_VOLCA|nr:uncharacterized protein VOLCADRAFT_86643 [Volvox carteri f. nagariensis]EFJ52491.1 hypothetical protein VOLCADRAFT_86643 [Volvox carteri f. nagariensis]|eukprot:XP_002946564.1 hypothetical protein VOLCADRAFT_86643 [Volvox carteri f. nagariensis]